MERKMKTIFLSRKEIGRIVETLTKFPDIDQIELIEQGHIGIGCLLDIKFEVEVNGTRGKMTVPIADESRW